jgi:hypothetical protein
MAVCARSAGPLYWAPQTQPAPCTKGWELDRHLPIQQSRFEPGPCKASGAVESALGWWHCRHSRRTGLVGPPYRWAKLSPPATAPIWKRALSIGPPPCATRPSTRPTAAFTRTFCTTTTSPPNGSAPMCCCWAMPPTHRCTLRAKGPHRRWKTRGSSLWPGTSPKQQASFRQAGIWLAPFFTPLPMALRIATMPLGPRTTPLRRWA